MIDEHVLVAAARAFAEHVSSHACDHDDAPAGTHTSCPERLLLEVALANPETDKDFHEWAEALAAEPAGLDAVLDEFDALAAMYGWHDLTKPEHSRSAWDEVRRKIAALATEPDELDAIETLLATALWQCGVISGMDTDGSDGPEALIAGSGIHRFIEVVVKEVETLRFEYDECLTELEQPNKDFDPDYMCPNCVTPWKCNGPHTPEE